jgi:hypothetical protein
MRVDTREDALPDEEVLNELGNQGWFLCGVLDQRVTEANGSRVTYYFMRQKDA